MKKNTIIVTIVCCLVFAGYLTGQNQTKEKHIEPCCCKHTQQIAEDLHWIRESMSKPFRRPPDFKDPGNPPSIKTEPVQKLNIKTDDGKINIPPRPTPPRVKK